MKKIMIAFTMLATWLFVPPNARADITNTKITKVGQTIARSNQFGAYVQMSVTTSGSVGTGCSGGSNFAIYRVYLGNANRDIEKVAMEGLRQLATSALLSGRSVDVILQSGCHETFHAIENISLR